MFVDTLRIVAMNIEANLAGRIAPYLRKPQEAKKVTSNVFAAPMSWSRTGRQPL